MSVIRKSSSIRILACALFAFAVCTVLMSVHNRSTSVASAQPGVAFGPACGAATPDGNVNSAEWSGASVRTFQMVPPGSAVPFTATLYVMNSGYYLYMGITINDDEFSSSGQWLPRGDSFRIDFDNDHSGLLFTVGDDNISITAGMPQFGDNFLSVGTTASSDTSHGGTTDGNGAASRVGSLNHFELRHPLCSGDELDFCLHPADIVGFRLEYLDAQGDGSFGGSQLYPGRLNTSIADIVIGSCSAADLFTYLPFLNK